MQLARDVGATALYAHQEVTYEELQSEAKVAAAIQVRRDTDDEAETK